MRRTVASVSVGLGVALLVAAVLVRSYAYPALAKVPTNYEGLTHLAGQGVQVLNFDTLKTETTDVSVTSRTIADSAADAPDSVGVWVNSTTVTRADGSDFQQQTERAAFDKVSGVAVDCDTCQNWVEESKGERVAVAREGQVYKFPFDTQKQDYLQWDGTIGKATPARYVGEEDIDGLHVYKFVQTIEPQVVAAPLKPADNAEMWYSMTRTFYIEPATGAPINRIEQRVQEFRYDGTTLPVFTGTVQYTADQVAANVKDAKSKAPMVAGMKMLFPILMLIFGALLLTAGLFIGRADERRRHDATAEERSLIGV